MNAVASDIVKYQGIASNRVINAVAKAASRTGADFSFLMEKASTESGFDASATSKKSSATGLFQFIESTWLNMVKAHGAKYGLAKFADQIEMKNGRPCVGDCAVKNQILNLRKNPEIAALMAGEYSAENKSYLQAHTDGDVGDTELYLAHFLGPASAAKFINSRACTPDASAARVFPQAAHVNKSVFYDQDTGKPRSLDQVYALFADKFDGADSASNNFTTGGDSPPSHSAASLKPSSYADDRVSAFAPVPAAAVPPDADAAGQALSLSREIIWNDDPRYAQMFGGKISPASILALAQTDNLPASGFGGGHRDRHGYNS